MLVSKKDCLFWEMFSYSFILFENGKSNTTPYINQNSSYQLLYCVSIIVPFRYLCYPNELFWTEEGFRFSWRYVDGKAGYATFKVKDAVTKKEITINNSHF
jgi:hypothetical protein